MRYKIILFGENLQSSFEAEDLKDFSRCWEDKHVLFLWQEGKLIGGFNLARYFSFTVEEMNDED